MLNRYSTQSVITDAGKYEYLYKDLPDDIPSLVNTVQNLLIHGAHLQRYGIQPSEERLKQQDYQIRKVSQMFERIIQINNNKLTQPRRPKDRLIVSCRHFAVLTCSFLRHKGIPARVRAGFETYLFTSYQGNLRTKFHDHWICEYWDKNKKQWIQIDSQIDDIQRKALDIKVDTLNLPPNSFLTGGQVWELCRTQRMDPNAFGVWGADGVWNTGWEFIQSSVILDFMALNKLELLPWDGNELARTDYAKLTDEQKTLLDQAAKLTTSRNAETFKQVRVLYESVPSLQMPKDWVP